MNNNISPVLISGVSCYEQDGTAYLKLEDVARGLGFTQTQNKNGTEYTSIRWERVEQYLAEFGFPHKWGKDDFIPENVFYRLAMKANNPVAEKFQALVADEIIPSIRKTGSYTMPKLCKEMQAIFLLDDNSSAASPLHKGWEESTGIHLRPLDLLLPLLFGCGCIFALACYHSPYKYNIA